MGHFLNCKNHHESKHNAKKTINKYFKNEKEPRLQHMEVTKLKKLEAVHNRNNISSWKQKIGYKFWKFISQDELSPKKYSSV